MTPQIENDGEQVKNLSEQARPADKVAAGDVRSGSHADIKIIDVEAQESGKLSVLGQAKPGATVGLYLNDAYIASAIAAPIRPSRVFDQQWRRCGRRPRSPRSDRRSGAHAFGRRAVVYRTRGQKIVSVAAETPKQVAAELPKEFVAPEAVSTAVRSERTRSAGEKTAERSAPLQSTASSGAGPTSAIPSIETKSSSLRSKSTGPTTTKETQATELSTPRAGRTTRSERSDPVARSWDHRRSAR